MIILAKTDFCQNCPTMGTFHCIEMTYWTVLAKYLSPQYYSMWSTLFPMATEHSTLKAYVCKHNSIYETIQPSLMFGNTKGTHLYGGVCV